MTRMQSCWRASAGASRAPCARWSRASSAALLALAERMLGRRGEAEDVAQEVFVRLWRQAPRWRPGARASTPGCTGWRSTSATTGCARRREKRPTTTLDERGRRRPARPTQLLQATQRGRRVAARARRAAAAPARGAGAAVLPGAVQQRGGGADGDQRRSAGKPAGARAPQPARPGSPASRGETMTPERFLCAARRLRRRLPALAGGRARRPRAMLARTTRPALGARPREAALLDRRAGRPSRRRRRRGADRAHRRRARRRLRARPRRGTPRSGVTGAFWPGAGCAARRTRRRLAGAFVVTVALGDGGPPRPRDWPSAPRPSANGPPTGAKNESRDLQALAGGFARRSTCSSSAASPAARARWWHGGAPPPPCGRSRPRQPALRRRRPGARAAPGFRAGLRDARREVAEPHQAAREGRQEVLHLLAEPHFDAAAMAQTLARTREADTASRARFEAA